MQVDRHARVLPVYAIQVVSMTKAAHLYTVQPPNSLHSSPDQ
jgi:hypothetical protein